MKHDENVDVRRVSRVAKIDTHNKVIQLKANQDIGIKTWGRIDYLCNILGYRIVKNGIIVSDRFDNGGDDVKHHNREVKKAAKAEQANKNMKKNKKK